MAKRAEKPEPPKPEPGTLTVLPNQLRAGDRFSDEEGEWEVADHPWNIRSAKTVHVKVQPPGDPSAKREKSWSAHERITVRRRADSQ